MKVKSILTSLLNFMIALILISLTSCNRNNDPINNATFGKSSPKHLKIELIEKHLISTPLFKSQNLYLIEGYRYKLKDNDQVFYSEVYINSDGYEFGNIRVVSINLNGDTSYSKYIKKEENYCRGYGPRPINEVDSIYQLYCKWYGKPDSISTFKLKKLNDSLSIIPFGYNPDFPTFPTTAFWYTDNCIISFHRPRPEKEEALDNIYTYKNALIKYQMYNYEQELSRIQDSISKALKPNDIIKVSLWNPTWVNVSPSTFFRGPVYKITIHCHEIRRIDREEKRNVSSIRFDVVLLDQFEEELYRLEDITYTPSSPIYSSTSNSLTSPSEIIGSSLGIALLTSFNIEHDYNARESRYYKLEEVRTYSNNNEVRAIADIKSIAFENGTVLK